MKFSKGCFEEAGSYGGPVSIRRISLSFCYLSVVKKTSKLLSVITPFTVIAFPMLHRESMISWEKRSICGMGSVVGSVCGALVNRSHIQKMTIVLQYL